MTVLRNATAPQRLVGAREQSMFASLALVVSLNSSAAVQFYYGTLTGSAESPPTASTGTGFATVYIDVVAHQLYGDISFFGLSTPATAAHVHCCAAPPTNSLVAVSLPNIPSAASGSTQIFPLDLTSSATWSSAFVTAHGGTAAGAEAALASGVAAGQAYVDIHTPVYPGGEIRAFLIVDELFANGFDSH